MKFMTILAVLFIWTILFECAPTPQVITSPQGITSPSVEELASQSKFIFKGTIVKLKAATMSIIQDISNTAKVKVDEIFKAREALGHFVSKEITVMLREPQKAEVGQQAVFFTNERLYGESLAVTEVGHLKFGKDPSKLREQVIRVIEMLPNRALELRLASADLVIVGRVLTTQKADTMQQRLRDSEHNPEWWEALISIENVEKGSYPRNNITVMFPKSEDIQWYRSPKFNDGQQGIWILRRHRIEELDLEAFTVLDPKDFYPKDELDRIRELVKRIK